MQRLQTLRCQIRDHSNPICMFLFFVVIVILAVDNLALLVWVFSSVFGPGSSPNSDGLILATTAPVETCEPALSLLPPSGKSGEPIIVHGVCWPALQQVMLLLVPPAEAGQMPSVIATLDTGPDGQFSRLVSVPVVGAWPRWSQVEVRAVDRTGEHAASATYAQTMAPGAENTVTVVTPTATPEPSLAMAEVTATSVPVEPAPPHVIVVTATPTQPPLPSPTPTRDVQAANLQQPPAPTLLLPTVTSTALATATSTPTPVPETEVWQAQFYRSPHLGAQSDITGQDAEIDFHWDREAPVMGMPANNFSVRWTRYQPFNAGTYRFYAVADDGIRVWLDNQELFSEWHTYGAQTYVTDRALGAGVHKLVVEYYEQMGEAFVGFWWESTDALTGWRGEYYDNQHLLNSPFRTRRDSTVDFDWGDGVPHPDLPADSFSVRWTQTKRYDAGSYQFDVTADDGFRLYVDGRSLYEDWYVGAARDVRVEAYLCEGYHTVVMEYFDAGGAATAHLAISRRVDNSDEGQ